MTASDELMVLCSATVSDMMRDIKSPVLARAKKLRERFCKWVNSFVRRSVTVRMASAGM